MAKSRGKSGEKNPRAKPFSKVLGVGGFGGWIPFRELETIDWSTPRCYTIQRNKLKTYHAGP